MPYIQHKSEESVEDYLETILILEEKLPQVRSIDIATEIGYSKPSISIAMKNLRAKGYIQVSDKGYISLTEEGKIIAKEVYERHIILKNWLIRLGVAPEIAAANACKMEHDISRESFEAIKKCISEMR